MTKADVTGSLKTAGKGHKRNVDAFDHHPDTRSTMSYDQDFSLKGGITPPLRATEDPRREKRLAIAIPIKVFPNGISVTSQTCCTYDISASGARLVAPQGVREVGQVISLQRQSRRAPFKVVWIGQPGTSREGQVGVTALNPKNVIWENELTLRLKRGE